MPRLSILCSLLDTDASPALMLGRELHRSRLDLKAHRWDPSLETLSGLLDAAADPVCALWCVAGTRRALEDGPTRRALSLAALGVQALRGRDFPIMILPLGGRPPLLPEALADAELADRGAAGKILARLHRPTALPARPWRLRPHCPQGLGLWLEVGPVSTVWRGALCGVCGHDALGAAIRPLAHAVGPAGAVPAQSMLESPLEELSLPTERGIFLAKGAGNELGPDTSYYVQLSAMPAELLLGPLPRAGQCELTALRLEQGSSPAPAEPSAPATARKAVLPRQTTYRHVRQGAPARGSQRS